MSVKSLPEFKTSRILSAILFSLTLLIVGCAPSKNSESDPAQVRATQIKGSDTMVNLVQAWAEEFTLLDPSAQLSITGGGSGTGFAALLNKTCEICMSSRSIDAKEVETAKQNNIEPVEHTVGLDGLMIIVHPQNPVSGLTLDAVRDIFMGNVRNWKDIGGDDRKIVILSRESNSGTHMFFKEHVLRRGKSKGKEEFSPHALLMPSSQAIVNEVSQNPHAIGYVGLGYLSPTLKAIPLARDASSPFIMPTVDNVFRDVYPISRPLYLYTDGIPKGVMEKFIRFALSAEGQKIVRELDFVPVGES